MKVIYYTLTTDTIVIQITGLFNISCISRTELAWLAASQYTSERKGALQSNGRGMLNISSLKSTIFNATFYSKQIIIIINAQRFPTGKGNLESFP